MVHATQARGSRAASARWRTTPALSLVIKRLPVLRLLSCKARVLPKGLTPRLRNHLLELWLLRSPRRILGNSKGHLGLSLPLYHAGYWVSQLG